MRSIWQTAPLGKLLKRVIEEIALDDDVLYREVTVRLWNKGVVLRGEKRSNEIKTRRFCVHAGQLILSRIDVRNGAIGLVPAHLDGAIVSGEFWTYRIDDPRIDPLFLSMYVATPRFLVAVNQTSSGTTHRIRAEEEAFLAIEIPLPPLPEQQRIVAHVVALAQKVEAARGLRREAAEQAEAMLSSTMREVFSKASPEWRNVTLPEICECIIDYRGRTPPIAESGIPHITNANIRNGKIDWQTSKFVSQSTYEKYMTRGIPRPGDVIFTMEAPLGSTAVVPDERLFSMAQRMLLLRGASDIVDGQFLAAVLTSPDVRERIYSKATGTTVKGIASKRLRYIELPIPPLTEQRRIAAYLTTLHSKVDELQRLQAGTQKEMDALMPSILAKAFAGQLLGVDGRSAAGGSPAAQIRRTTC